MIEINDKRLCSGCGACMNICPKDVISMREDDEGCRYPIINKKLCIDCGLCEKVCPILNISSIASKEQIGYPLYYAGQLIQKEELTTVSSGGAFWAIGQALISNGGVVYGVIQSGVDVILHSRAETIEELKKMRRSKYLQSDTGYIYRQVKMDLNNGRDVLFTGTGCQIAALFSFLKKKYDNLYTCDVVCHGVPSDRVWRQYREEKQKSETKVIQDLNFRDKTKGWSKNQYCITYEDGSEEREWIGTQLFHAGYLEGLFLRPSCGSCKFAKIPRKSDITLADYWKYRGKFIDEYGDLGVSLIVVNNPHGGVLLNKCHEYLELEQSSEQLALQSCRHLWNTPIESPWRNNFFALFYAKGYYVAAQKYIGYNPILYRIKNKISRILNSRSNED